MNRPQQNQPRPRQNQRGTAQRRRSRPKPPVATDLWADAPPLPTAAPIVVPAEVDALLRSLGDAPAIGGSTIADRYFAAVVERTAAVAAALALSADVLAE